MSPSELIHLARADGIALRRSSTTGQLRVLGDQQVVERWMTRIRHNKAALLSLLEEREERAAIYEYEAKFTREEAEKRAGL